MKTLKRTWADVSMDDLEHNYNAIIGHIPSGCRFLGVIKADAYGHGAVPVSQALTDLGAAYLAVSNLEEAIQIRRAGIRTPILILGYTPPEYADSMVFMDITQEVHSLEYAEALEAALSGTNYILNVHLKLDTGMTRIGFFAYGAPQTAEQLLTVCRMRHLRVEGAFTHFSVADSKAPDDVTYTKAQVARFTAMLAELAASGVQIELRHCCSSGATILYPEFALDMVRPGIATYGLVHGRRFGYRRRLRRRHGDALRLRRDGRAHPVRARVRCARHHSLRGTLLCEQAHPTFLHGKWPSFADFAVHRLTDGIEWNESIAGRYKSVRRMGNYR